MRLCMDRLLPAQKDRPIDLPLGTVETLPQVRAGISTVVQAISDGSITPTAGETVANVLHPAKQCHHQRGTWAALRARLEQVEEQLAALQNQALSSDAAVVTQVLRADRQPAEVEREAA